MTKLGFLLFSTFFIFLSTTIINYMPQFDNQSNIFDRSYPDAPPEDQGLISSFLDTAGGIFDYITVFFDIMTFRVDGLPAAFSLVFLLLTIGTLYIIVTLLRGGG